MNVRLQRAVMRVVDAYRIPGPHPDLHQRQINRLHNEWGTLYFAIKDLVYEAERNEPSPVSKPPVGEWYLLIEEDFVGRRKYLYLFRDNGDGTRDAYMGKDTFQTIPEGVEAPVWLTMSDESYKQSNLTSAFKHVYVVEQRFKRIET